MGISHILPVPKQEAPFRGFLWCATPGLASAYCSLQSIDSPYSGNPNSWSSLVVSSTAYYLTLLGIFCCLLVLLYTPNQFLMSLSIQVALSKIQPKYAFFYFNWHSQSCLQTTVTPQMELSKLLAGSIFHILFTVLTACFSWFLLVPSLFAPEDVGNMFLLNSRLHDITS